MSVSIRKQLRSISRHAASSLPPAKDHAFTPFKLSASCLFPLNIAAYTQGTAPACMLRRSLLSYSSGLHPSAHFTGLATAHQIRSASMTAVKTSKRIEQELSKSDVWSVFSPGAHQTSSRSFRRKAHTLPSQLAAMYPKTV
jgi:hypothetical protein